MTQYIPVDAIVELVNIVQENAASDRINCIWLLTIHVDLDTYWTVYFLAHLNQTVVE